MAKRQLDDFESLNEDQEFLPNDAADQAFWDEFWTRDTVDDEESPLVTITIKDQGTGEEKVLENVRLRFRNFKKIRD